MALLARISSLLLLSSWAFAFTPQVIFSGILATQSSGSSGSEAGVMGAGARNFLTPSSLTAQLVPTPGTWSNFYVNLDVAPGAGTSYTFTFRTNNSSSSLTCTASDSQTSCSDTDVTHSSHTVIGDVVSILLVTSGSPTAARTRWTIQFMPDTPNQYILMGCGVENTLTNAYTPMSGNFNFGNSTAKGVIPLNGTFKNLYVSRTIAPGAGHSMTYTYLTNAAASSLSCVISGASATSCSDVSDSSSVVAGDIVQIRQTPSAPNAGTGGFGVVYVPNNPGEFPVISNDQNAIINVTTYDFIQLTNSNLDTTESRLQIPAVSPVPGLKFKNLYAALQTAPGSGTSYTITLRQNAASPTGGPACTVSGTATTCNDTSGLAWSAVSDLWDYVITPSNTPGTTGTERFGITGFINQDNAPYYGTGF